MLTKSFLILSEAQINTCVTHLERVKARVDVQQSGGFSLLSSERGEGS